MPTYSVYAAYSYSPITLNTASGGTTSGSQSRPEVVHLGGSRYLVAWLTQEPGQLNFVEYGIFSSSTLSLLNGSVQQTAAAAGYNAAPAGALLDNGQAVLVWQQTVSGFPAEYMARVDGTSGTLTQAATVLDSGGFYNGTPDVTAVSSGFIVGYGTNDLPDELEGALLNGRTNTGAASGIGIQSIVTGTTNQISHVATAQLANGTVAAVWRDATTTALSMRVYNADGTVAMNGANPIQRLSFDGFGTNGAPTIAALPDGKFVVAYSDTGWGGIGSEITLAMFTATGGNAAPGGLFVRVTNNSVNDADPDIAVHDGGYFTVVFTQTNGATGDDIYMRTYNGAGTALDTTPGTLANTQANERFASVAAASNGSIMLAFEVSSGAAGDSLDGAIVGGRYDLYQAITGDGTDESLTAGDFRAILNGNGGHDQLQGGARPDKIYGGGGNDTLRGGGGADEMFGGLGDDQLIGEAGDYLFESGNEGTDTAWITQTGVALSGAIEVVRLVGTANGYAVASGFGAAPLQAVANPTFASTLQGGAFDDVLWGSGFADFLEGMDGNDTIRGGGGADILFGGNGDDHLVVSHVGVVIHESSSGGTDTAWVTVNGWTVSGTNLEITRLAAPGANQVTGGAGNDVLVANQGEASTLDGAGANDELWGSGFADSLVGGAGDDIIRGQGGADTMRGGTGHDAYVVLSENAVIVENAGEGYDTLWIDIPSSVLFTMAAETERANLAGTANAVAGNALDNVIVGNPTLANDLRGGDGADILFGSTFLDIFRPGAGNDVIYSLGGNDRIIIDATGSGYDQVAGFVQGGAKIWFQAASGITSMAQLTLNSANGNTQVEWNGNAILVFGVASMSATDFLFS